MALEVYYQTAGGGTAYTSIGTAVRWGTIGLTESAELGEAAISSLTVDDAPGTADYVGLRKLYVTETAAGTASQVVWHGYVADQTVTRGDLAPYGSARVWLLSLVDDNAGLGYRVLSGTAANRSAESGSARLAWALTEGSGYIANDGLVSFPGTSVQMDATDYRGQYLTSVLGDISNASGYEYFAQYNAATGNVQLFFADAETSTAYPSTITISNVAADIDGTAVVAPDSGASLSRDPSRIAGGVYLPYNGGAYYGTASDTITEYGWRDQVAPSSSVKTAAKASAVASRLLTTMNEQEERITCRVWLPKAQVNDIRAGHRIQAKFNHFPSYDSYRWCRVVRRTVSNFDTSTGYYELALELVPQTIPWTASAFSGAMQSANRGGTVVFLQSGDSPSSGWYAEPTVASAAFTRVANSFGEYIGWTVNKTLTVRIQTAASYAFVANGTQTVSLLITKNGSTIGTGTSVTTGGLTYRSGTITVDLSNQALAAGDEIRVVGSRADGGDPGWQNVLTNNTFMRIGRGTQVWNSGAVTWTGP